MQVQLWYRFVGSSGKGALPPAGAPLPHTCHQSKFITFFYIISCSCLLQPLLLNPLAALYMPLHVFTKPLKETYCRMFACVVDAVKHTCPTATLIVQSVLISKVMYLCQSTVLWNALVTDDCSRVHFVLRHVPAYITRTFAGGMLSSLVCWVLPLPS